jgi:hypothetical protein
MICLAAGIAGWSLSRKNPSPVPPPAHSTGPVSPLPKATASVRSHAPREPLPPELAEANVESSDEDLLRLARIIVDRSPAQALQWAQSQTDPALRERLLLSVLRAWGEKDPRAAVAWVLQDENQSFVNMEAALMGAATQPDLALQIGRELRDTNADSVSGAAYGTALVMALSRAGNFQTALQFANEMPDETRGHLINTLFNLWAQKQPAEAVKALDTLANSYDRARAFSQIVEGWAASNPAELARYAVSLSADDDRTQAFDTALAKWSLQDPASAGEWLNSLPASPELDRSIARLITQTDSVNRSPEVAMSWIASIADSTLRNDSLLHVMKEWTGTDPEAAWHYIKEASWIGDNERAELQKKMDAAAQKVPEPD